MLINVHNDGTLTLLDYFNNNFINIVITNSTTVAHNMIVVLFFSHIYSRSKKMIKQYKKGNIIDQHSNLHILHTPHILIRYIVWA